MRLFASLVLGLAISITSTASVAAQAAPGVSAPTLVLSPSEVLAQLAYDTPSPFGALLPGLVTRSGVFNGVVDLRINLDDSQYQYTYACDAGDCAGFAGDVWMSLGVDQRQAYLDSLLDGITSTFPDTTVAIVQVVGQTNQQSSIVSMARLDANAGRTTYTGI